MTQRPSQSSQWFLLWRPWKGCTSLRNPDILTIKSWAKMTIIWCQPFSNTCILEDIVWKTSVINVWLKVAFEWQVKTQTWNECQLGPGAFRNHVWLHSSSADTKCSFKPRAMTTSISLLGWPDLTSKGPDGIVKWPWKYQHPSRSGHN